MTVVIETARQRLKEATIIAPHELHIIQRCGESADPLNKAFADTCLTTLQLLDTFCRTQGIEYELRGGAIATTVAKAAGINYDALFVQASIDKQHAYCSLAEDGIPIIGPSIPIYGSVDVKVKMPPSELPTLHHYVADHLRLPHPKPHELPRRATNRLRDAYVHFQPQDFVLLAIGSVPDKPMLPMIALELVQTVIAKPNDEIITPQLLRSMDLSHFPARPFPITQGGIYVTCHDPSLGVYDRSMDTGNYNVASLAAKPTVHHGEHSFVLPPRPAFAQLNPNAYEFYQRALGDNDQLAMRLFAEASIRAIRYALVFCTPFTRDTAEFTRNALHRIAPFWNTLNFPHIPKLISHLNLEMEVGATISPELFLTIIHTLGIYYLMHPKITSLFDEYGDITSSPLMASLQRELPKAPFRMFALERAIDTHLQAMRPKNEIWFPRERSFLALHTPLDMRDIYDVWPIRT